MIEVNCHNLLFWGDFVHHQIF